MRIKNSTSCTRRLLRIEPRRRSLTKKLNRNSVLPDFAVLGVGWESDERCSELAPECRF